MKGITYLQNKLELKRSRGLLRYKFYEQKQKALDFGISTPEGLEWFGAVNGWCTKAVDALADRIQFDGFDNDNFMFQEMYEQNNPDIIFDNAILSALVTACCFIYISRGEDGSPRFQVIDGTNGTGIIDDITELLTEGYAVLERDEYGSPKKYAYFIPGYTYVYEVGKEVPIAEEATGAEYCALVPIIYRPDAKRPFGHSRISRACMDYARSAMRTVKRSEISAEFYSYPQKYVLGMDEKAEQIDKWKMTMSSMLRIDKDEDGDHPVVGQFHQQSMTPHMDQLKSLASLFAGETGLTLDDLGFVTSNPSSAEAIKAAHENLRLVASKAQRCFSVGFINAGFIGACIRDRNAYNRSLVTQTKMVWRPTFEPDMSALSIAGDGLIKLSQALPNYVTEERVHRLTGID